MCQLPLPSSVDHTPPRWSAQLAARGERSQAAAATATIASHSRTLGLERVGLIVGAQGLDDVAEVAVHHRREVVAGEADAVIGDAVLREVVRADLLRAIAGADQRAAGVALGG